MKKLSKSAFNKMALTEKLDILEQRPEYIIYLSDDAKKNQRANEVTKMVKTALRTSPQLITKFKEFGIIVYPEYAQLCKDHVKDAEKYVDLEFIKIGQVKAIIQNDLSFISKLPEQLKARLNKFIKDLVKNKIGNDDNEFYNLPKDLQEGCVQAVDAFVEYDPSNIAVVPNRNINGGKPMFKAVRQNSDAIAMIPSNDLRFSLVKYVLKLDPNQLENLPASIKNDPKVRYQAYRSFASKGMKEEIDETFSNGEKANFNKILIKVANKSIKAITLKENKLNEQKDELENIKSLISQ